MKKHLLILSMLVSLFVGFAAKAQISIPGDSIVYGPMFSPVYDNSVRVWVLTKSNTGTGENLELSFTNNATPGTEITGTVFNSDTRLDYNLRSFEFTGLTEGDTYTTQLIANGTPVTNRATSITNGQNTLSDFEFLSGGCGRIYDLTRCIDQPEAEFHINGTPTMFNTMAEEGSDLMVWLGDATYLLGLQHAMGQCPDGVDDWANKDMAFDRYRFQRDYHDSLTVAMPQLAIPDNHDLGPNEFDKNMPTIGEMREIFMDWWPNPEYLSTPEGQGLHSSYKYKDVEYFLTDNRSYRDNTHQHFGPDQLEWLKQGLLNSTATFKVIVSGTPVFYPIGGRNFSVSNQYDELFNYIQDNNINGVLALSADIHEQKFLVTDGNTNYPLYDVLSGNINSDVGNGNFNTNYDSNHILQGVKQTYLSLLLILSLFLVPRWNYLLTGWDTHPLYIADVTKIFLFSILLLLGITLLINRFTPRKGGNQILLNSLKFITFILFSFFVYNWNAVIANWIESAVLYVPHITKIYLGSLFLASIVYRGFLLPIKREESYSFLFPFRWIKIGLLGLLLDLIKLPGYTLGAFISIFRESINIKGKSQGNL